MVRPTLQELTLFFSIGIYYCEHVKVPVIRDCESRWLHTESMALQSCNVKGEIVWLEGQVFEKYTDSCFNATRGNLLTAF